MKNELKARPIMKLGRKLLTDHIWEVEERRIGEAHYEAGDRK